MKKFSQLETLIQRESIVETHSLRQVQWTPGTNHLRSDLGTIQVKLHYGLQMQIKQRTGIWIYSDRIWQNRETIAVIQTALTKPGTQALLEPIQPGLYSLYGLINPNRFRPTNKWIAQSTFHKSLNAVGINTDNPHHWQSDYGAPRETFHLPNEQYTAAKITLQYGLDNGVDAYKLWLDDLEVLICSNGLVIGNEPYKWSHQLTNASIEDWLQGALPKILSEHAALNQQINWAITAEAEEKPENLVAEVLPELTPESFSRICRLVNCQYAKEAQQWGQTLWAVSQALSHVGTHQLKVEDAWGQSLKKAAARILGI